MRGEVTYFVVVVVVFNALPEELLVTRVWNWYGSILNVIRPAVIPPVLLTGRENPRTNELYFQFC